MDKLYTYIHILIIVYINQVCNSLHKMSKLYYPLLIPQNYVIEEIILGSIIINPDLFNIITENISIKHIFLESHQIIYRNLITIQKKTL